MADIEDVTDAGVVSLTEDEQRDLLSKIRQRYEKGVGANELNRRNHTADLAFIYEADQQSQWDPQVLQLRQGRPSYTFNRVLQPVNMLIGDQRQTRPSVKVRPASQSATLPVADIFGGMWRSIEQESRAEAIYDDSYKQSVGGGFGEMRILPEYENDQSFDQVLRIQNIPNPLTVVRDPESTDPCGADARWCMVGDRISRELYDDLYPGDEPTTFAMARDSLGWRTENMIRVVDYFEKIAVVKEIAELSDGRVVDWTDKEKAVEKHLSKADPHGKYAKVVRTRKVNGWKIRWLKCDGARILKGPIDYDWQRIPVVRMPGRYINIEGRQLLQSLVRHSWDSQRAYNFQSSDAIERSALVPKSRYLVTAKMVNGYDDIWNTSHTTPRIYLPYNVDKDAPNGGAPFREQPIDVPAGAVAMAQKAAQDVQATTGMFDPALGNADDMNRVSGKALVTHTRRSDLASHEFIDGYGKALQLLCEMGLDMIPTVYDSARVVRIIGADGSEDMAKINHDDGSGNIINDLSEGRYDCTVTLGPSYQTARQESLATLIDAAQTIPAFAQVTPDLIAKAIDNPDSDEMAKRLRRLLIHQGIIQPTQQDLDNMGPPPQPNPLEQAQLQRAQALAARDGAAAKIEQSKAATAGVEAHRLVIETAGRHLANIIAAQKAGGDAQTADAAESQAA
jgi:hypothetical protein